MKIPQKWTHCCVLLIKERTNEVTQWSEVFCADIRLNPLGFGESVGAMLH